MLTLTLALLFQAPSTNVVVTIDNPRSTKGAVLCSLFNAPAGFPGKSPLDGRNVQARFDQGKAICEFASVPAGTWAVTVLHDENGNGVMDTGLFGVPKEGYGASNNVLPALTPPSYDDARFQVKAGEPKALSVRLKY